MSGEMASRRPATFRHAVLGNTLGDSREVPLLSVVVSVYRSENCLTELARRLHIVLGALTGNYEIIFVDDAGGDKSWDPICSLAERDKRVHGIQFSRNFEQQFALTAGIDYAQGDWVVTMDCDLQDPPEAITALFDKAQQGYDLVLARRISAGEGSALPLTSRLFACVFNYMTGIETDPTVGAFRIFSRRVRDSFAAMREQGRFFGGMMQWLGFPCATVDVLRATRFAGESSYNFRIRFLLAIRAILAFSNKPLAFVTNNGFMISLGAFAYGMVIAIRKMVYGIPAEGWTSVIVSLYFLSGMIMTTLGVVGIYVGKTFEQAKGRPLYIIRRTTHSD